MTFCELSLIRKLVCGSIRTAARFRHPIPPRKVLITNRFFCNLFFFLIFLLNDFHGSPPKQSPLEQFVTHSLTPIPRPIRWFRLNFKLFDIILCALFHLVLSRSSFLLKTAFSCLVLLFKHFHPPLFFVWCRPCSAIRTNERWWILVLMNTGNVWRAILPSKVISARAAIPLYFLHHRW